MRRLLSPEEAGLWAKVMASVRPLRAASISLPRVPMIPPPVEQPVIAAPKVKGRVPEPRKLPTPTPPPSRDTLDGSWDRKLEKGMVVPDSVIDLHGHTLASAHALLDDGLARAIARRDRVLLLVTGKPPRAESERPHARGAIRAAVGDWIGASCHADAIAAIRGAHPRHGGTGALYLIFRKPRGR